jgi:hydrogenase maturation protease
MGRPREDPVSAPRILVAGIGNIFLGDDAFGVEVAQRLLQCRLPETVRVVDFGIRGLDLTYALLDGPETVILVDAAPRGQPPGTLYVVKPEMADADDAASLEPESLQLDMHGLDPAKVLRLVRALGGHIDRLLLVGCEPAALGSEEEMSMGLSEPVRKAVDEAVGLVQSLLETLPTQDASPVVRK